jgi:hypothetical protein
MPNWCFTDFVFHGNNNEITDFRNKLAEYTSKNYMKNGFGPSWLGNILCGAGLGDHIDSKVDGIRCRGNVLFIDDVECRDNESTLYISTQTAWVPMVSMWTRVIETLNYESIRFTFRAEEPGCDLYVKYDPLGDFVGEKYYVDTLLCGEDASNDDLRRLQDTCYYASYEHLVKDLQTLLKTESRNVKNLIAEAHLYKFADEDSYVSIHTYEDVNIDDFN